MKIIVQNLLTEYGLNFIISDIRAKTKTRLQRSVLKEKNAIWCEHSKTVLPPPLRSCQAEAATVRRQDRSTYSVIKY